LRIGIYILSLFLSLFTWSVPQYIEGQFIIKTKKGVSAKVLFNEVNSLFPDSRISKIGFSNIYLLDVSIPKGQKFSLEIILNKLRKLSYIEHVEPNFKLKALAVPNDTYYFYQWNLEKIQAPFAWNLTVGDKAILVAVIDTGIDIFHNDLNGNIWLNPNEICDDGKDNDANGYVDDCYGYNAVNDLGSAVDDNGHGTHVAGIIGAIGNNEIGISGINWKVSIVGCKFLNANGWGSLADEIECLNYIKTLKELGYNIVAINASYGGYYVSQIEKEVMSELGLLGILIIAAAGNDGVNVDQKPLSPCSYSVELPNVICVAATDEDDKLASFSNYGVNTVQVAAPGVNILSTYLDNSLEWMNGTSMAAPHVTGLAALVKSYKFSLSSNELKDLILRSVDNLTTLTNYISTGGRINLFKAMILADNVTDNTTNY